MRYEVTSTRVLPTNGNAPFRRKVSARSPRMAAEKAYVIGGGALVYITPIESDSAEGRYVFNGLTNRQINLRIVVEEIRWYEFWKII